MVDASQVVVGIVRITDRLGNVYENFREIRKLEITAMLLSMLAAAGLGIWLARRIEVRLQSVITAVEQVANPERNSCRTGFRSRTHAIRIYACLCSSKCLIDAPESF